MITEKQWDWIVLPLIIVVAIAWNIIWFGFLGH